MTKQWLVVGFAFAACSSGTASTDDGGVDLKRGQQEVCMPDGKPVMLAAQYGVQASLLVNVKVTPTCSGASCIVDTDANSELLLLATVTQNGTSATITARPCKIVIPPVALKNQPKPLSLTAAKTLVQSVLPVMSSSTLSANMTCANFNAQPITLALGANLMNAASDPLPGFTSGGAPPIKFCGGAATTSCATSSHPGAPADSGCVCDQDADGKAGATLQAMNVPGLDDLDAIYVDLRTSVTLTGQVFPAAAGQTNPGPRLIGKVTGLKLETNALGCHRSTGDCADADTNTVAALNPAITQSANGDSTFVAVPLAAGDTCDSLVANEAALFNQ